MENRAFYDRISGAYDLLADSSERACRERGLAALQLRPGERVMEVGFGTGHALVAMAESVGRGGEIVGVDVSTGMLAVTKPRVAAYRNVALITGDARHLSLLAASFDAAAGWVS
jgi:demethylmenaquinone methyltransferase/2-methoxy-6-polyprenyl-1,4-benzoquinol methylase